MFLPNESKAIDLIQECIKVANQKINTTHLILVANVRGITENSNDYEGTSITSEYWAIEKFETILNQLRKFGFEVSCFYDEKDFIQHYIGNDHYASNSKELLVINFAQKGTNIGRKSLIPSFCDLYKIRHTGSNPYVVSLARNKYHSNCILEYNEIPTAKSYLYHYEYGWIGNKKPNDNQKVIAKLNYESSSIGLTDNNIFHFSVKKERYLRELSMQYNQPIIVQHFIQGYEIELPVLCSQSSIAPIMPIGISLDQEAWLGESFLDYSTRKNREYGFYNFFDVDKDLGLILMQIAYKSARLFDFNGFCRVDFRINHEKNIYITDVATNPGITKETSFFHSFDYLGFSYDEMLKTVVGIALR